ncbi:MAG: glycosyltransferase [Eubacteriales bacterium]|nr:glycosyltransferase [Eubacteriales bacterium]
MSDVKVSIIVPVYNVERYLPKCLDTLTGQTLKEIQIIVVNDGATDGSQEIIDRYAARDERILPLKKVNGGLSDARNFGLPYATGKYVGYVDSDDFVEMDMYEKLFRRAEETGSEITECDLFHNYDNGFDEEHAEPVTDPRQLLMTGRSVVWNKIYRLDWLRETGVHFMKGLMYEDVGFYSCLMPHLHTISYVPEALIHYVQRGSSLNYNATLKTLDILKILEGIRAYYKKNGYYESYEKELEFLTARIILCSSFLRMSRIGDPKQRAFALGKSWKALNHWYPDWKKNPYLKKQRTKNAAFMRAMNPVTYRICGVLMPAASHLRLMVHSVAH